MLDINARVSNDNMINDNMIIGPTVAGPTIPVIPAGTDYTEPGTDLEDPATVPHPGSVEIHTYRALREDTRRHALRRISRLAPPTRRDQSPDPAAPPTPAQEDRIDLDRTYPAARRRPQPPPDTVRPLNALDLISNEPLPDDPPF